MDEANLGSSTAGERLEPRVLFYYYFSLFALGAEMTRKCRGLQHVPKHVPNRERKSNLSRLERGSDFLICVT